MSVNRSKKYIYYIYNKYLNDIPYTVILYTLVPYISNVYLYL